MNSIEEFIKTNDSKSAGIIAAYLQRENRYHAAQSVLVKGIIPKEDGKGKIFPAFSDAVLEHIEEFRAAESAVATVRADLQAVLEALGEFASLGELADARSRARLQVESAERAVKIALSKASITAGEAAMESEPVIKASIHRDQIRAEVGPTVAKLEERLKAVNAILERY